jgi:hypothetical protein
MEVGVPLYLGLAIPRYAYGPTNLVRCPGCVIFLRSVCSCSPASLLWTPENFAKEMRASLWGANLMALLSIFGCLGAIDFRPS